MREKQFRVLSLAVVPLLAALSCTPSTITKTEIVTTLCSATAPTGACDVGQSCFQGACVATASLCSPTNLSGTCADNTSCFIGGCVVTASLCGTTSPNGPCNVGSVCQAGTCVATASLCSSSNTTGTCPSGQTCSSGLCIVPVDAGTDAGIDPCTVPVYSAQPIIGLDDAGTRTKLTVNGLTFKDNNGNGKLDPFEDWRLPEICRARNLVTEMTVPEKIGLMGEGGTIGSGTTDGTISTGTMTNLKTLHLRQALIRLGTISARQLAVYLNNIQRVVEGEPHGIPFLVTTDPVHGITLTTNATTGVQTNASAGFNVVSPWPQPMGLGAINDLEVTRLYGDTVRREFMAMGFRWQLGPQADVATEPRWARTQNTFGENAYAVANHARTCVEGFQGVGKGGLKNGIAATIKHFPGAGADQGGMDSHSRPGRYNVFPGNNFRYHQISFQAAIDAQPAAIMPCYSIFKGQVDYEPEQTGAIYSHSLITNYLKTDMGFNGLVTSDWGTIGGTAWGVEALTPPQRAALFLRASAHQFGSDSVTIMQTAYDMGFVNEAQINEAAIKVLEMSFKLGIFENPYVDPDNATAEVRSPANLGAGLIAQKKAMVILKNREHTITANTGAKYLPIDGARRNADAGVTDDTNGNGTVEVYFDGVNDGLTANDIYDTSNAYDYTAAAGTGPDGGVAIAIAAAATPNTADIALVRISARKGTYFGLDNGVPLSWDAPFAGTQVDGNLPNAVKEVRKVIDLLRLRDGYTDSTGAVIAPVNPTLKIVLVVHMDRAAIFKPFLNGLTTLDETTGLPGSYPLVSNNAIIRADGLGGIDVLVAEFGAFDRAVLDVLFNKNVPTTPTGYVYGTARMPFETPSSDSDVNAQYEDVSADTANPTFVLGAGQTY